MMNGNDRSYTVQHEQASDARKPINKSPDAKLIALCAKMTACDQAIRAIYDGPTSRIAEDDKAAAAAKPIWARQKRIARRIVASRAQTAQGILALAATLADNSIMGEFSVEPDLTTLAGTLSFVLMRDALALAGKDRPTVGTLLRY